ncbi:uncharacterized protein LOC121854665 [Homarus americanus]|uniref:Putative 50 kDa gamma-zein-like n=1 Tax=Homarus americanus TaxID=6706 RepID=A0A8J5JM88_HOMAM|nr:uncharacterized protein LOC121854665 [Homarus americanus]KAG7155709.1 putative 50 kDa gamma-zein-like [Homarus americanus]
MSPSQQHSASPSDNSNTIGGNSNSRSTSKQVRYKGLFTPQVAPTTRAYCLLLSFLLGTLMLTAGSVFYHVIQSKPMSGSHPMHTPPLPLALFLLAAGIATLLSCFTVAWKYGFDDGDESLEEDLYSFAKDDVLDQQYSSTCETPKDPPV